MMQHFTDNNQQITSRIVNSSAGFFKIHDIRENDNVKL
jgi:hypothetical protein